LHFNKKIQVFFGPRITDSLKLHRIFARKQIDEHCNNKELAYNFKYPQKPPITQKKTEEQPRLFTGMNPKLKDEMG
jgi:hypothetical protein